jgi:hypothetical protein
VKGVYTTNIAKADVMQAVLKIGMSNTEIADVEGAFESAATTISLITIGGILSTIWVFLSARCCNKACGGCWAKWYAFWASVDFLIISIVFFILGSVLIVIKDQLSEEFILQECENAKTSPFGSSTANLDLSFGKVDISDFFVDVVDLDNQYARSINSFMCTDFCICPGLPTDQWVKEYKDLPTEKYTKYKRTKTEFTGKINLGAFAD